MRREEVYKIIDNERNYQDRKWGGKSNDEGLGINDFILYMQHYLAKAIEESVESTDSEVEEKCLEELRKVVALGIACMEVHGVPERFIMLT